MRAHIIGALE